MHLVVVRPIAEADIAAATGLLSQLGYPMSEAEAARRLALVLAAADHRVWVADESGHAVGLLHAFFRPALEKPPEVVVEALVIDVARRSQGIGEKLMQVVEAWARERGSTTVSLYSGAQRTDAHRFYERLGYVRGGPSHLMRKVLV
jgi:GNAT superfamily N-acetyltransferase